MSTTTRRSNKNKNRSCCLFVPIHPAAIVISVFGVIAGGVFGVVYALNISTGMVFLQGENKAYNIIPLVGMACWTLLALISLFGAMACWTARSKFVAIYFWALLFHYILDLGFLVAGILAAVNSANQQYDTCVAKAQQDPSITGLEQFCAKGLQMTAAVFISILVAYKLIATYTTYVIFKYKRFTVEQELERQAEAARKQQQDMMYGQSYGNGNDGEPRSWSKFED